MILGCKQEKFSDFKTHKSGIKFKYLLNNTKEKKAKIGEALLLKLDYYTENDSLLFSSRELKMPFKIILKKTKYTEGTINDALSILHLGDSAHFLINAELFYKLSLNKKLPNFLETNSKLLFKVKLIKIISIEELSKERLIFKEQQKKKELSILDDYIKNKKIETEALLSGLYFIEIEKGKGKIPSPKDTLIVHYTGKLLNGKKFDSSYDRNKPFKFVLGASQVIDGWEEGLSRMNKGGKAKLIIPSYLAYGEKGYGNIIPPYTTLVFEIELMDIKTSSKK